MRNSFEKLMDWGGAKREIVFLVISGIALVISLTSVPLPFNAGWIAVIFCGIPIVMEAVYGLITRFDIKADVLVSIALFASLFIGQIFAAGEVAFIMRLGGLLETLTVAKARAGIEKLARMSTVKLTGPRLCSELFLWDWKSDSYTPTKPDGK